MKNNTLHIYDLNPYLVYVYLEKNFREIIFNKAIKNVGRTSKLIKILKYSSAQVYDLKKGYNKHNKDSYMSLSLLFKLAKISNISLALIEKNIKFVKYGRTGTHIVNIFPLKLDKNLASLIGHATGDGHIKQKHHNFQYRNKSNELIERVEGLIKSIFKYQCKIYKSKDNTKQVESPSIIGYILFKIGASQGNKVLKKFDIPQWIKEGEISIFSSYLSALIDDEGTISFKNKFVSFGFSKNVELKDNLTLFLNSIEHLFSKLQINCSLNFRNKLFLRKDKIKTISLVLTICGQDNIKKIDSRLSLTHKKKVKTIKDTINSYQMQPYKTYGFKNAKEIIINRLQEKNHPTSEILKEFDITKCCVRVYLNKLKDKDIIKEIRKLNKGEILWSLNKGLTSL